MYFKVDCANVALSLGFLLFAFRLLNGHGFLLGVGFALLDGVHGLLVNHGWGGGVEAGVNTLNAITHIDVCEFSVFAHGQRTGPSDRLDHVHGVANSALAFSVLLSVAGDLADP